MVRTRGASFSSRGESSRRKSSRGESSRGESSRRESSRGESSREQSSRGESSAEGLARRRPTASEEAYQAYEGPVQEEAFEASDDDYEEEEHDVPDIQEEDVGGFPGGPRDVSLLTHYVQHVAYGISQGQICYDYVDKGLLLGFIERWHFETSSFHLPVGEMTITLDDVSTLLHLPVLGQLCDLEELEFEEARTALVDLLDVDGGTTGVEMDDARGTKVRLSWLRDIYVHRCRSQDWDYAARAYMLHLVGCTIFANKSASSIRVSYLLLFRDVHACGRYAWGVAALAHLYEELGDASLASTKQMAGYLTFFQSWIYEHFPRMGRRRLVSSYDDTTPRATRWQSPRQSSTLAEIREQLDGLTYSGVVWHPYEAHRGIRPLFGVCMYSGWIRIGNSLSITTHCRCRCRCSCC
ncbi:protein MAIN-LIKE 1-like [Vigna radiata var. radiata]|uniref:Protein MAIN-LIKE 1-like n=1 Tax=Vigna radiata var. radiata TaxID=3916 RepID=A0A1S3T9A0_VIGRR|nr:protein MAIN-LIKE 1-like [Vigna radiata var. radiata]